MSKPIHSVKAGDMVIIANSKTKQNPDLSLLNPDRHTFRKSVSSCVMCVFHKHH